MQESVLNEESGVKVKKGFWRRQLQTEATKSQKIFDWIFGAILPVICFAFDPIVFKTAGIDSAFLGVFKPFAYLLSFVSIMALAAWLIWGAKLKWLNAFLAGLFAVGAIISFGVGVVLFPFSVLGLIILIGVLGFAPLFSALVFWRNAVRAYKTAKPFLEKQTLVYSFALSALFSVVVPSVINLEIKRVLDEMVRGDAETVRANARILQFVAPIVNFDALARQHRFDKDEKRKAVAEVYEDLTGKNLERRISD